MRFFAIEGHNQGYLYSTTAVMPLPQEPPPDSASSQESDTSLTEQEFEQAIATLEQSLHALKARYTQVQQDKHTQTQLQAQKAALKQQQTTRSPALKAELTRLQTQLDELEVNLESQLFSWGSLREPFWQIVRFGGLGMIIGWSLAFAVLQPTPAPRPPAATEQSP